MNDAIRMQISAFVDGELPENEAELLLRRMSQDIELRQKVADYLAIGRMMRGEVNVPGIDRLHERVAAAISETADDVPLDAKNAQSAVPARRSLRPLAGFAVAATVALAAIFGLQMTPSVEQPVAAGDGTPVVTVEEASYTVPQPADDQLRQYYLSHGETASAFGANGFNSRFVTLRLSEEVMDESAAEDAAGDEAEETDEAPTQP
jgi:negative regulator of sigma E activity